MRPWSAIAAAQDLVGGSLLTSVDSVSKSHGNFSAQNPVLGPAQAKHTEETKEETKEGTNEAEDRCAHYYDMTCR